MREPVRAWSRPKSCRLSDAGADVILIDTSAWVHFLRPDGDADVRQRVQVALRAGLAAWCPVVRLELWNGAGGDRERATLKDFTRVLPDLPITPEVWDHACELARASRSAGVTVPATDLLILACAHVHGADLVHADADFDHVVEHDAGAVPPVAAPRRRRT